MNVRIGCGFELGGATRVLKTSKVRSIREQRMNSIFGRIGSEGRAYRCMSCNDPLQMVLPCSVLALILVLNAHVGQSVILHILDLLCPALPVIAANGIREPYHPVFSHGELSMYQLSTNMQVSMS